MTLLELIAALVASALVVALATRLFLTGHREYLARVFASDRLSDLVLAKGAIRRAVAEGRVAACAGGSLRLAGDTAATDLAALLKARFPGADSLAFRCLEVDASGGGLVEWRGRHQPQLVEYSLVLRARGAADRLQGSVLK